jgi:tetrapyrrole methylase family protein/MazG family protein
MTIHIAGLGPGSAGLLTIDVRELLGSGLPVIVRTRHHPTVAELDPEGRWEDCDSLYEAGGFDEVYERIARRVLERLGSGGGIFAVPGHPRVAEVAVTRLEERAAAGGVETRLYPGLSYVDVALAVIDIDAANVQLCDALDLRVDPARPALVAQLFDRDRTSQLKLQLLDLYPPEHRVTLLSALGTAQATTTGLPLAELDHGPTGYLDALFVPALASEENVRTLDGLAAIVRRLNSPGGCPWDQEQTHESLRKYLLEETHETLEALDAGDRERIAEELGDLLLQVFMHAEVARREDTFALGDVTAGIGRKLIRRHPHVFGTGEAKTAADVERNWERLKQREKPGTSLLGGVPAGLPALAASQSLQGRARKVGFDWPDIEGPLEKLREEIAEFAHAEGAAEREDEFGDILFVAANIADRLGLDAEQCLRLANQKFRRRFEVVERLAEARNLDMAAMDIVELDRLWDEAKARLAAGGANEL